MRRALTAPVLLVLLVLLVAPAMGQQDFSQVEMQVVPVAGNVHMLVGAGGNIGVSAGDDGILIIDDQFAPLADKIKAALASIQAGDLEFVLNTHWHGDHTGSNAIFGLEATIVAHENVRQRLSTPQTVRGNDVPASPPEAWPVITFSSDLAIHFNGEAVHMRHAPAGHTDGDSIIFFEDSNVVHMGDHFFAGRFPFVDLGSGGSVEGMAENVGMVIEHIGADTKVIPGHGALSSRADLELFHAMLIDTMATVQKAIDAGKSLEDTKAAGLSDKWADWGSGFINTDVWIETVYTSLSQ
ncbi:MAG: MBL fold metallo-hydrolase [Thermoanaerobaculia bacterium]|nr:MBL fold metallo-hydrolase [Thermoanaerobaculia bacterium]